MMLLPPLGRNRQTILMSSSLVVFDESAGRGQRPAALADPGVASSSTLFPAAVGLNQPIPRKRKGEDTASVAVGNYVLFADVMRAKPQKGPGGKKKLRDFLPTHRMVGKLAH